MNYSAFSTYSCIRYYEFFKLAKLLGGKTICLPPPQYFHWGGGGATAPLPPRIDASVRGGGGGVGSIYTGFMHPCGKFI